MKKVALFLLSAVLFFAACNDSGESTAAAKDSAQQNTADSVQSSPLTPAAQNSDDPDRFSQ
jgi:outer membrane lipoprotein-sorting protein